MNILHKFTFKNLMLNKKRTIMTIIGVMLSTSLICAVSGMVSSVIQTLVNYSIYTGGNYHYSFQSVHKENLKYIKENVNVDSYFLSSDLGYANLDGSKNPDKPYIYVMEFDETALHNSAIHLSSGRFPENDSELIISEHILSNARVPFRVGDTITLNIGQRCLQDGSLLYQNNPFLSGFDDNSGETLQESIINTKSKTYTIVGIMDRLSYSLEDYSSPGYSVISLLSEDFDTYNVSVLFKDPTTCGEVVDKISDIVNPINVIKNINLLRFQGAVSNTVMDLLYGIATVIIVIIVISSVFVIRNSFSISVSEKTRQFGMLTSVGATKKQIRKAVTIEGFFIGIVAIPLGILSGIFAIVVLTWIVNLLLVDFLSGCDFVYSVPFVPIALTVLLSFVTIYLSSIIPAIRASKISPIEAIRGNSDVKISSRKIRTSPLIKKLFGIGGVIASKNLKRSKKKYRTTVISLVVSISIFIALSSFLQYGSKTTNMYYVDLNYNLSVYNDGISDLNLYKEIIKLDNIDSYSYSYTSSAYIDMDLYGSDFGKDFFNSSKEYYDDEADYSNSVQLVAFNNEYFKEFVKQLNLNSNDYKHIAILVDDTITYVSSGSDDNIKKVINHFYDIKDGDTISTVINDKITPITITKKSDIRPMGYEKSYTDGGFIFVSEDFFGDVSDFHLGSLRISSSNANELESSIIDLKNSNPSFASINVTNYEKSSEESHRFALLISIFLYGFIVVITLIGVTNIFNTISTNMILRSKEFANLKSIGMTSKEFNRMIRLESILYGLKSLFIGIPIGLLGSYFIYNAFANSLDFGFIFPTQAVLISIVFVFIIVWLTMKYSLNKINKQNIIDIIRNDNI